MKIAVPDIVSKCIFKDGGFGASGGTTNSRHTLGHMKLTYVAKKLFGIQRYSTHPERFSNFHEETYSEIASAMEEVTDQEWADLISELGSIYEEMQKALRKDHTAGTVTLQRRIKVEIGDDASWRSDQYRKYGEHVAMTVLKAQHDGHATVDFETDILTGWCSREPGAHGAVVVKHEFRIEDVFLSARYIDEKSGIEVDEWLVLNRHPSGLLKIDPKQIEVEEEVVASLHPKALRVSWPYLKNYRFDQLKKNLKLPLCWPA
jgi:hypothetical protein